jgi:hypothetical protein
MDLLFDANANRRLRLAIADAQLDVEEGWFGQWRLVPVKKPVVRIQLLR